MGQCYGKNVSVAGDDSGADATGHLPPPTPSAAATPAWPSPLPAGVSPSPARSTPRRFFKRPFPPPSPAKHIKASLAKRQDLTKPPILEEESNNNGDGGGDNNGGGEGLLDKRFGYRKNFGAKYEVVKEVGRGHFGHTCSARAKKGEMKGEIVAVKIISKAKMMTAISIEDVRREVKILRALSGHSNLVKFYDACEDALNVYIVMELCEGGELLDRILSRGGRYREDDAKVLIVQMISVVAFFHLQGVVHRDLKPENFLFSTKDENAPMKVIDFGLSDFIRPDERLNDIVGSAYYVAPEVLHRSYSTEADVWSIGVITYILLCGSRPFWARTESGIFRSVLRADPNFVDSPWPDVSLEAKDFVRRLLNKDYRKRMTAAQALAHPWLRDKQLQVPLDILIYKLVKGYLRATPFKRAALKALSRALSEDELIYIRAQFNLLEPNKDGRVSLENFRMALLQNATNAMKEAKVTDILSAIAEVEWYDHLYLDGDRDGVLWCSHILNYPKGVYGGWVRQSMTDSQEILRIFSRGLWRLGSTVNDRFSGNLENFLKLEPLAYRRMDFEEFSAAAISPYQLESLEGWEQIASTAFEQFEHEGNRIISVEELAQEMNLGPAAYPMVRDWIRPSDGKLNFLGYTKFLHGVTIRSSNTRHHHHHH